MDPDYLFDFRDGWRMWCRFDVITDCKTDGQRHGWRYADGRNDEGGNQPRPGESYELDAGDVATAASWRPI